MYQLGEDATGLEAKWLSLYQQMRAVNVAITQNLNATPQTEYTRRAVVELKATLTKLKAQADAVNQQINAASLTPTEKLILKTGNYAAQSVSAAGDLIKGGVGFVASTAGDAAGAATKPLILPLLAIGVALYLVGKGGVLNQAKPWSR